MKTFLPRLIAFCVCGFLVVGCHRHDESGHHHDHSHETGGATHGHSHGDDAQSFSGATHKEGKGITLLPETKERLGVTVEEVRETALPKEISFTARVYGADANDHFEASGILPAKEANSLGSNAAVTIHTSKQERFEGLVTKASNPISTNETELVVRFASPKSSVSIGSFLQVAAKIASEDAVSTIPKEALIKGATESFVYVQNGDAYLRTIVEPGRQSADTIEIKEGLLEGDSVVCKGAMDLWLVELRAVKGGQGCCPAPPAKGKGK